MHRFVIFIYAIGKHINASKKARTMQLQFATHITNNGHRLLIFVKVITGNKLGEQHMF